MDCISSNECDGFCKLCTKYHFLDLYKDKKCAIGECYGDVILRSWHRFPGHSALLIQGCSEGHIHCSYYELRHIEERILMQKIEKVEFEKIHFVQNRDGYWYLLENKIPTIYLRDFDFLQRTFRDDLREFLVAFDKAKQKVKV